MKKFAQILQIVLLVFLAGLLIFFIAFETLGNLFGMAEVNSDNMVSIFLVGLILFLISWLFNTLTLNSLTKTLNKKEVEMNKLKAKLYDLEHPHEPAVAVKKPAETPKITDNKPGDGSKE
ncbi:hypothetical protein [Algoriphagus namhaensis]